MQKHYLTVEEHREVSKKLKEIENILSSLYPLIDKYPKTSKVARNFYKFYPLHNNNDFLELKSELEKDLPFEDREKYPDSNVLMDIYYGGNKNNE